MSFLSTCRLYYIFLKNNDIITTVNSKNWFFYKKIIKKLLVYNKFDKLEFAKQNSHTTYGRFYPNLYTVWSLFGIKSKRLMPLAKSQWHLSFPGCSRSKFYRQFHRYQPLLHSNWRELNLSYPAFWQKSKPAPFMKTSEFQKGLFHREINMTKFWVPIC